MKSKANIESELRITAGLWSEVAPFDESKLVETILSVKSLFVRKRFW
jgi:hypothetical protein